MLLEIKEPSDVAAQQEPNEVAVGIDLGTTNSLISVAVNGEYRAIENDKNQPSLPSIISYFSDGSHSIGEAERASSHVVRSIKRLMGKGKSDVAKIIDELPYKLADSDILALDIDGREVTPVEISSYILKALKNRAEKSLGKAVKQAVITVPAYFDDAARAATKDAAKLAGLEVLRLINEPTAAALAYGLDNKSEGIYAIYDLGGGTFDVSLLKMEKGVFQVLATGGDASLGGDDLDNLIANYLLKKNKIDEKLDVADINALLFSAQDIKEHLSTENDFHGEIFIAGKMLQCDMSRPEFEELASDIVQRTIDIFNDVLADSKLEKNAIKGVVLVGGSTRIPLIHKEIEEFWGAIPLTNLDPDKIVSFGAALQAEALTKGSSNLLLDVTPLSLGIETMGGLVEVLIARNTPIPTSVAQKFTTYKDNQTAMKIHVLQGEREMVDLCRSLANFELKNIPPMPAGGAEIEIIFALDSDGLLTVSAQENTTRIKQEVEVKPSYGLPSEKIEQMLLDSMAHAKEDIMARLLAESRLEANQMVESIESALKKDANLLESNYMEILQNQISLVKKNIAGNERDLIELSMKELDKLSQDFAQIRVNKALGGYLKGANLNAIDEELND